MIHFQISVGCLNKFHEAYTALHVNVLHRAANPRQLHRITYLISTTYTYNGSDVQCNADERIPVNERRISGSEPW